MSKTVISTWALLIILTIVSAVFGNLQEAYRVIILMILVIIKFCSVGFQFMELKKAHVFWKTLLIVYIVMFALLLCIIS